MKYFDLIDELFDFKYLLTEDNLNELPIDMREKPEDLIVRVSSGVVEFDERMRTERNIRLFLYLIQNMPVEETEIESIDELKNLLKFKGKTGSGANMLITSVLIGSRIYDMDGFTPLPQSEIKQVPPGYPMIVGTIDNLNVVIDPYMSYNNKSLYFYNKEDIRVACFIKDIVIKDEATFHPKAESNITTFKKYNNPALKVVVNIPEEELI